MEEIIEKDREERGKGVSETEKISDNAAVLHLVKGNIGIGVLAIPSALLNAGLTVGTLGLAVVALTTVHCMHLLGNINQSQQYIIDTNIFGYFLKCIFYKWGDHWCILGCSKI